MSVLFLFTVGTLFSTARCLSLSTTVRLQPGRDAKLSCLSYLIDCFGEIVALVTLAPECNMAGHFACIPQLLCGSVLHLALY